MLPWQFKRFSLPHWLHKRWRCQWTGREERQRKNQLDKRHERNEVRGGGATRGSGAGGWDASA
jgi:hypothetical protein